MNFQVSWHHAANADSPVRGFRKLSAHESITVGRESGADILLSDEAVSRLHAEIFVDGVGVHVKDRGSANGLKLAGRRVTETQWPPGQSLQIGPFLFELTGQPEAGNSEIVIPSQAAAFAPRPTADRPPHGRIKLGEVYNRAKQNDPLAVRDLFSGFLGQTEQIVDCGYLGSLGIIFPVHCFWTVTNSRVCGLMVHYAGWVSFQFGFIKSLNRATFNQPSLIKLWVVVVGWLVFGVGVGLARSINWLIDGQFLYAAFGFLATIGIFALTPVVVWVYYRFEKTGCVFWTQELVPIWIFSDRHSIHSAQRFISVFTDQKQLLGD